MPDFRLAPNGESRPLADPGAVAELTLVKSSAWRQPPPVGGAGSDLASWMLLGGPAAALAFGLGVTWLGVATPGYGAVRQTISELGPQGGKGRRALAGLNLIIALAAVVFACGLVSVAKHVPWTTTSATERSWSLIVTDSTGWPKAACAAVTCAAVTTQKSAISTP